MPNVESKIRRITKEEIETILKYEEEKILKENILNSKEINEYLKWIKSDMEYCWTNLNYENYWKRTFGNFNMFEN